MELVVENTRGVWLSSEGNTYRASEFDLSRLVHFELLSLFKVWTHQIVTKSNNAEYIYVQEIEDSIELDILLKKELEVKRLLKAEQLIIYYVLSMLLKIEFSWSSLALKPGKKNQLLYASSTFNLQENINSLNSFEDNDLSLLIKKSFTKKEIEQITERFFILFKDSAKLKLATALSFYKSRAHFTVEINPYLEYLFNEERLNRLRDHMLMLK